jgi:hypothetical protein
VANSNKQARQADKAITHLLWEPNTTMRLRKLLHMPSSTSPGGSQAHRGRRPRIDMGVVLALILARREMVRLHAD